MPTPRQSRHTSPSKQRRHAVAVGLAMVVAMATLGHAEAQATPVVVDSSTIAADGSVRRSTTTVEATDARRPSGGRKADAQPNVLTRPGKVDPRLTSKVDAAGREGGSERVRVLVVYRDDQTIPRLPEPAMDEPRSSDANVAVLARTRMIADGLRERRAAEYRRIDADFEHHGARVVERYWLIKAVAADVPLQAVDAVAAMSGVLRVELDEGARPPFDVNFNNDEADARALIRTDPYFSSAGWIGLIDTGVRASHTLFNAPGRLGVRKDLTTTVSPNPDDDCWNHGTSSAGILSGNINLTDAFRGITGLLVDSFKVYPKACGGGVPSAAVTAFQEALKEADRVIVAELQFPGNEVSAVSVAADAAFDAGAVVIAANGNFGPNLGTVNVPAVAQKVIGVGAVDVETLAQYAAQSRGPAGDGRIKPDVQAPTNADTASSVNDVATQVFTGTSGATPHAAGAAALIRNFLGGAFVEPGAVYAHLIMTGSQTAPFNNTNGAGLLKLGSGGVSWRGKVAMVNAQTLDVPNFVAATPNRLSAAIWWPEKPAVHNDIDLALVDPSGVVRATSSSSGGVFERVSVNGPIAQGTWKLRISGFNVPSASQQVYWTMQTSTP